jgi:hypothetical protein
LEGLLIGYRWSWIMMKKKMTEWVSLELDNDEEKDDREDDFF